VPEPQDGPVIHSGDIVFDCPHCGKSLAIDPRGVGLMIACPDCGREVQVPAGAGRGEAASATPEERAEQVRSLAEAVARAQEKIERLVANLEEVRERRSYLEKLRTENLARFERIGQEMVTIQNAMDRIVSILQEASTEKGPDVPVGSL